MRVPKNIFVLGLDEMNRQVLEALPQASRYRFRQLLTIDELQHGDEIPFDDLLDKATRQLASLEEPVDAVVGYWDFPVSSMVPILCERFGLRSASLESVIKCEHKYWSRLEQQKVTDAHPRFALVDLDDEAPQPPDLRYPFWVKPVKSFSSDLAHRVEDEAAFDQAMTDIREGIGRVGEPFDYVLGQLELPPEIEEVGGQACLAEEAMDGAQATVEGYSMDGDVHVYGVVDSLTHSESTSFLRFQYPSRMPDAITDRMTEVSRRVISQVGLDAATFNVEFFWDREQDTISLLEVNPRHSQSHAKLFEHVDGLPNHTCMVELALGAHPDLPHRQGPYGVAAKWFLRRFEDGTVRRSPTPEEIADAERDLPGTTVDLVAHEGKRLSELHDQDSYSYKLANIYMGAADEGELVDKYERCVAALPFAFDE
jgi:hypothetical protein